MKVYEILLQLKDGTTQRKGWTAPDIKAAIDKAQAASPGSEALNVHFMTTVD